MTAINLFNLFATVSLDTSEYDKSVKEAAKESETVRKAMDSLSSPVDKLQKTFSAFAHPIQTTREGFANVSKTVQSFLHPLDTLKSKVASASEELETKRNKLSVLSAEYENAKKRVSELTAAFNKSAKENGASSESTKFLAQKLKEAEDAAQAAKNDLESYSQSVSKAGNASAQAGKQAESLGSKLKSGLSKAGEIAAKGVGLITGAATAAGAALLALESSTEEYRIAQGKLNTAFEAAGYSADTAKQAYSAFYGILGDTDTATEASQLLAKLAESEEDVATWTNIAAGVSGTFGDSLPIESLIEASNETAKVGTVTGTLADALNWAGISEDEFNEKLAACTDESDRNRLIMETLSGTYDDAADAFYRNNEALVESRNNQAMLDETLATLGQTVSDVKNRLLSEFLPSISAVTTAFAGMISGTEGADEQFADAVGAMVTGLVEQLPQFLSVGVQILSSIVSGIIQSLPTLIAAVPQLVQEIVVALQTLWPVISDAGGQILNQIANGIIQFVPQFIAQLPIVLTEFFNFLTSQYPVILEKGTEILNSLIDGIIGAIPDLLAALPQLITSFVNFIATSLPQIAKSGVSILSKLISGIISAIPDLTAAMPKIITAIVKGISSLLGSVVDVGKNIVEGIWQGISAMASWITNKVKSFFNGIVSSVKNLLGIHSPSTVFEGMGENMALGLGKGWDSEYSNIKRDIEKGLDIGDASASVNITRRVNTSSRFSELENVVHAIISGMNIQVVLDDGTLVGKIAPKMNNALGDIDTLGRRGGCTA